jgi:hypothetical protein
LTSGWQPDRRLWGKGREFVSVLDALYSYASALFARRRAGSIVVEKAGFGEVKPSVSAGANSAFRRSLEQV